MKYDLRFWVVWEAAPDLLRGAQVTLLIAVATMVGGLVLAFPLAITRRRDQGLLRFGAAAWIEAARNTPCLFQIYAFYFGLGAFGFFLDAWAATSLALLFNNAGYTAEILRGGLAAVSPNQMKAARSLGLTERHAYLAVIVPQVLRIVYYPLTNQFIWSLLNSSLGAIVGLTDLSGVAMVYQSSTFRTFEFFLVIGAIYFLMAKGVLGLARVSAWRLFRY
jgi:His/Glu/Gln/Arg/opine family amino acid ABC transporter permease subunit